MRESLGWIKKFWSQDYKTENENQLHFSRICLAKMASWRLVAITANQRLEIQDWFQISVL
jgi:hypothetical protein